VDYDETFIRVVLGITASQWWPIHQLDAKNAFLHGSLEESVVADPPT
jgi:hypothetical protein